MIRKATQYSLTLALFAGVLLQSTQTALAAPMIVRVE